MGRPVQGHFQRPTLAGVDRAAVHGFAGLFRSAAGLSVSLGCGYWGRPSVENSVSSCCSDNCARQLSISSLDSDQLALRICAMHAHLKR
jgi:hypothetical protein